MPKALTVLPKNATDAERYKTIATAFYVYQFCAKEAGRIPAVNPLVVEQRTKMICCPLRKIERVPPGLSQWSHELIMP
jgi:hypothetical protein